MRDERDRQAPTALWKWPRACERHIPHPESIRAARQNTVFRAAVTASPGNWCLQHVALRVLKHILENFQRILNGAFRTELTNQQANKCIHWQSVKGGLWWPSCLL
jgi:hypothetical protein